MGSRISQYPRPKLFTVRTAKSGCAVDNDCAPAETRADLAHFRPVQRRLLSINRRSICLAWQVLVRARGRAEKNAPDRGFDRPLDAVEALMAGVFRRRSLDLQTPSGRLEPPLGRPRSTPQSARSLVRTNRLLPPPRKMTGPLPYLRTVLNCEGEAVIFRSGESKQT